jgi:hypothetical protein
LLNVDELRAGIGEATPTARVRRNAAQTISNGILTAVQWDTVVTDAWGMYDSGSNTRLTIKVPGIYLITSSVAWADDSTGVRFSGVQSNGGGANLVRDRRTAASNSEASLATIVSLDVNDYLETVVLQNTGGNLDLIAAGSNNLAVAWVAPNLV